MKTFQEITLILKCYKIIELKQGFQSKNFVTVHFYNKLTSKPAGGSNNLINTYYLLSSLTQLFTVCCVRLRLLLPKLTNT